MHKTGLKCSEEVWWINIHAPVNICQKISRSGLAHAESVSSEAFRRFFKPSVPWFNLFWLSTMKACELSRENAVFLNRLCSCTQIEFPCVQQCISSCLCSHKLILYFLKLSLELFSDFRRSLPFWAQIDSKKVDCAIRPSPKTARRWRTCVVVKAAKSEVSSKAGLYTTETPQIIHNPAQRS